VLKEAFDPINIEDFQEFGLPAVFTSLKLVMAWQEFSVVVKGSSLGTTTDATGNFAITVPDNATLVFSYVGYDSKEVAVAWSHRDKCYSLFVHKGTGTRLW
jgi:hypothetical protein